MYESCHLVGLAHQDEGRRRNIPRKRTCSSGVESLYALFHGLLYLTALYQFALQFCNAITTFTTVNKNKTVTSLMAIKAIALWEYGSPVGLGTNCSSMLSITVLRFCRSNADRMVGREATSNHRVRPRVGATFATASGCVSRHR